MRYIIGFTVIGIIIVISLLCTIESPRKKESRLKEEHKYGSDDPVYRVWRRDNNHGTEKDYSNWLCNADPDYLDWLKFNPDGNEVEYQLWLDCDVWDED